MGVAARCDGMTWFGGEHHVNLKPGAAWAASLLGQVHPGTEISDCEALCGTHNDHQLHGDRPANRTNVHPPPEASLRLATAVTTAGWEPCAGACAGIGSGVARSHHHHHHPLRTSALPTHEYRLGANWSDWDDAILLPPFAQIACTRLRVCLPIQHRPRSGSPSGSNPDSTGLLEQEL